MSCPSAPARLPPARAPHPSRRRRLLHNTTFFSSGLFFLDVPGTDNFPLTTSRLLTLSLLTTASSLPAKVRSCCFTKSYTRYAIGSGSLLQTSAPQTVHPVPRDLEHLRSLGLRYFTPREVARLHGFPEEFRFAPALSLKQNFGRWMQGG